MPRKTISYTTNKDGSRRKNAKAVRYFEQTTNENYYYRRPHELPTIAGSSPSELGYKVVFNPTIKPLKTLYGRSKGKSGAVGMRQAKDLYMDEVTGLFYEVAKTSTEVGPNGESLRGSEFVYYFRPADGTYFCRYPTWATKHGYQIAEVAIAGGQLSTAYVTRGEFAGEVIRAEELPTTIICQLLGIIKRQTKAA